MFLVSCITEEERHDNELNYRCIDAINEYWNRKGYSANARLCPMTGFITSDIKSDWNNK